MVMDISKKNEIASFTDQVRVICVKNGKDKPTLGKKIGMDNDTLFTQIKNKCFKPDPKTYFKLETEICGKNEHYRNKLRQKYEKTLDISEWSEYTQASADIMKPTKAANKKVDNILINDENTDTQKTTVYAIVNSQKEDHLKMTKSNEKRTDKNAKKEFYKIFVEAKAANVSVNAIDTKILGHQTISNMRGGWGFVPTDKLKDVMKMAQIDEGSEAWQKLVDLQLSCIAGSKEDIELAKYEKIFGSSSDTELNEENSNEDKGKIKMANEDAKEIIETTNADESSLKTFSNIFTKWLFMKGYTLKQTARTIGCSEAELKSVINSDICLSPYHVNRLKDTIGMDDETISKLVKIANVCYKGHEIPQSILNYISSDMTIISTMEEIVRQNKPAQFWDEIWKKL